VTASLSDLPNYAANAYLIGPTAPFVPENIILGSYTFLPWVRSGAAAAVTAPPAGGLRASLDVQLPVQAAGQPDLTVDQPLLVRGPGDVLGLDERHIIRRYPVPGTANAEDSFLAHIEFDRPELPWLFSPAAPNGDRLIAWLALVVLADGRYSLRPGQGGLADIVTVFKSELQRLDQGTAWAWAWAHAQIIGPASQGPSVSDRLTTAYGPANLSRLICPRHLDPDTGYLACVVPTYDAGVQAGLGTGNPGTLGPAWHRLADGSDANETVDLPVYTSWRFATGPAGVDFASLAGKLAGFPCPWQVGRRITDTATPGGGLPDLAAGDPGRLQTVHGPLVSPQQPDPASHDPAEAAAAAAETTLWPVAETEALREQLNRPDALARTPPASGGLPPGIPVVGPEIYARYHAAQSRVLQGRDGDWFGQLNLQPEHRIVAGLGARVVQRDVEQLMQSAWAQVGAIDDANRQLRRAQLALAVSTSWHQRTVAALPFGDLLGTSRAIQSRVLTGPAQTVAAAVAGSSLAASATTAAFRRVTRPSGPLARFAAGHEAELTRLVALGATARDYRRPYRDLDGVAGLSPAAATAVDPAIVAPVLGVAPSQVVATLLQLGAALAAHPALPDLLTPSAVSAASVTPGFNLAQTAASRALAVLSRAAPADPAQDPARAVSIAGALTGLSNVPGVGEQAGALRKRLVTALATMRPVAVQPGAPVGVQPTEPTAAPLGAHGPPLDAPGPPPGVLPGPPPGAPGPPPGVLPGPPPGAPGPPPGALPGPPPGAPGPPPGALPPSTRIGALFAAAQQATPADLTAGFSAIARDLVAPDWPGTPDRPALSVAQPTLTELVRPAVTLTARVTARIGRLPSWLPAGWFDDLTLTPPMAAPVFTRSMYQALDQYSRDWLLPGLATFRQPDIVSVLKSNASFVEAFLAGLSHEMARALLWRGYPTDQRGTYFRRFWNPAADELAQDLYAFTPTPLSTHVERTLSGRVVLLVRGELIRRHPDAVVLAMFARRMDPSGHPAFEDPAANPGVKVLAPVLFHGHLQPDKVLVGFDLTVADIQAAGHPGWWFVISEHPTAPRFGLREGKSGQGALRDPLGWDDMVQALPGASGRGFLDASTPVIVADASGSGSPQATFGADAASTAHVLLRNPVRAAFAGHSLLAPTGALG
jgi:hypothetical protein